MSSAGPWSVKGIDPKAREVAKDLARRSGMTLGEWLNQMIIEGEPEPLPPPPRAAEPRRRAAIYAPSRYAAEAHRRAWDAEPADELSRLTRALESFSDRLEAAEHRSSLAISGIDQSVMGVLSRLDEMEQGEGGLDEVRAAQAQLAERLRRMEDGAPGRDGMKAVEAALGRLAAQMYEADARTRRDVSALGQRVEAAEREPSPAAVDSLLARVAERLEAAESRTSAAVRGLEARFAGLDQRLASGGGDIEDRFERLAAELAAKVDASRAELARDVKAAADGRVEGLETALRQLGGRVEAAERKSAEAIDRLGREVVRIAHGLGQRVEAVETRSVEAVEQMSGEMARFAEAMETRMRASDTQQAEALERLGTEIGRIAERLADRIAASEQRAAAAIDDVGDQVSRVTDKLGQRYDHATSLFSDRIRESEERTARLLQEARQTLDTRQVSAPPVREPAPAPRTTPLREPAPPAAARANSALEIPFGVIATGLEPPPAEAAPAPRAPFPVVPPELELPPAPIEDDAPFDPQRFVTGRFTPPGFAVEARGLSSFTGVGGAGPFPNDPFAHDPFADDPFAAEEPEPAPAPPAAPPAAIFAPEPVAASPAESDPLDLTVPAEPEPVLQPPRATTRELIEAARAAARQAAAADAGPRPYGAADEGVRALRGAIAKGRKRAKKEAGPTLRTALLASGTAAALSMTMVGAFLLARQSAQDDGAAPPAPTTLAQSAIQAGDSDKPEVLAEALTAAPATPEPGQGAPAAAPNAAEMQPLLSDAVRRIESGDAGGLDSLRKAANLGYAPAQFYLARLYESGSAGLPKNAAEARLWTERAAIGGEPRAMHDLGLYYFEGAGGAKSLTEAAAWFRRAAEAGYGDSQYNLARLYEQGYGVPQNDAEALKWYLVAAAGGDREARASADRLRAQLPPQAVETARRSAQALAARSASLAQR